MSRLTAFIFLFQTCLRLCLSWSSWQPAAAFMGRRSAACWMSEWPSCTPTWMGGSLMLPGFCPAGCPCPVSGEAAGDYQETHSPREELITQVFWLGSGTELTKRSRTFSSRWFRSADSLGRTSTTCCRPSLMPLTSNTHHPRTLFFT